MRIVAIKQTRSGHNVYFISNEYAEYELEDLLSLIPNTPFENIKVVTSKTGKKSLRIQSDDSRSNNLENVAMTCNIKDYLFFDGAYLYLKTQNGRIKKRWIAISGDPKSTKQDQDKADFGPIPSGSYIVRFDKTLDYQNSESLWDQLKWLIKQPRWGLIVTPLEADSNTNIFGRGDFYIHGGDTPGSKGCIDLTDQNANFHSTLRLYKRNFKLIVNLK
jgi:hypothetical protein